MKLPFYAFVILAIGWFVWSMPFWIFKRNSASPSTLDRRARWGILIEGIGYAMVWQGRFWSRAPNEWQVGLAIIFLLFAWLLSWRGVRALGRQWRIDAGINTDHGLIRSGPYRVVRHPIYASMFCMLLATGTMIATWPLLLAAVIVFLVGTEIRVRVEDGLLTSRFGDHARDYQRSVPAYIPFIR
jgi:protein-S-isoprenylcysteine O-methyltransferase Ste14